MKFYQLLNFAPFLILILIPLVLTGLFLFMWRRDSMRKLCPFCKRKVWKATTVCEHCNKEFPEKAAP